MPTKQQENKLGDQRGQGHERRNALIGNNLISLLGQPGAYHRVQVRSLWEDRYRVNVILGSDATNAKVTHSYFLVADGDGNIVESNPQITKLY